MTDLDKKVFGSITTKEIIGADPPALPNTKHILENELKTLLAKLDSQNKMELENILREQQNAEKLVNSRPGAMALAQDKIQLYTEFSQKYIQSIKKKLQS